jgi:hypothetical protein
MADAASAVIDRNPDSVGVIDAGGSEKKIAG